MSVYVAVHDPMSAYLRVTNWLQLTSCAAQTPYHKRNSAVSVADSTLPGEELARSTAVRPMLVPYLQLTTQGPATARLPDYRPRRPLRTQIS